MQTLIRKIGFGRPEESLIGVSLFEYMDIIELYEKLKRSYKEYIASFVTIKDSRIKETVANAINDERLWPDPLIQFNPNFAKGIDVQGMIAKGLPINPELNKFFSTSFYKHQQEVENLMFLGRAKQCRLTP